MLLSKLLNVANTMNVVATGDGVFVNDVGPFRHTGGGVLEMNGQEAKWLFTRTEHEVILQKSDALAFRMYVKKPWHWDARATILPLSLPILLAVPALVFGACNVVGGQGVTSAICSHSQVSLHCSASTWNCSTTRRITSRKDPPRHSLAGGCC